MVTDSQLTQLASIPSSPLIGSIFLAEVHGGEATNPLWTSEVGNAEFKEALRQSLAAHHLLTTVPSAAKYHLSADLRSTTQPLVGLNLTVTAVVHYKLVSLKSGTEESTLLFNEMVTTPYTAQFEDSFIAVERLRLANEGAIRENISAFLERIIERVQQQAACCRMF